jgi:hypothetical protein
MNLSNIYKSQVSMSMIGETPEKTSAYPDVLFNKKLKKKKKSLPRGAKERESILKMIFDDTEKSSSSCSLHSYEKIDRLVKQKAIEKKIRF